VGSPQVDGRIVSAIGPGLLVLVGVHEADTDADADYMYIILSVHPAPTSSNYFLQLLGYTASVSHCLNSCLFTHDYIFMTHQIQSAVGMCSSRYQFALYCVDSVTGYLSWRSDCSAGCNYDLDR
jgi:hypothetical protein